MRLCGEKGGRWYQGAGAVEVEGAGLLEASLDTPSRTTHSISPLLGSPHKGGLSNRLCMKGCRIVTMDLPNKVQLAAEQAPVQDALNDTSTDTLLTCPTCHRALSVHTVML